MVDTPQQTNESGARQVAAHSRAGRPLARIVLIAMILVLIQAALGMVVNLYAQIPDHHPGAQPANYFSGSYRSVVWALSHGTGSLAAHAGFGLVLILVTIAVAIRCLRAGRSVAVLGVLATLLVIGAGFNGASFLDFNKNVSSLIMALLALASLLCYGVMLFLLTGTAGGRRDP